ncbi:MAG: UDP-N-acetylmuramoyl-tripeptide--D-alanyl-D-alanine ligase [Nitrospirota bacterium]
MITTKDLILWSKGKIIRETDKDMTIKGISIDSRTIKRGEIFIPISGKNFDGNDFIKDTLSKGASGVIVESGRWPSIVATIPESLLKERVLIKVADTLRALQDIASSYRKIFALSLVAITGSNGKTTTKEMTAGILGKRFNLLKSEGNINNHIGVPLTLFRLKPIHEAAVIEMGISLKGELSRLCEIACPDIGVITNIGYTHLETLKDIDGVREGKGEIISSIGEKGTIVLNGDDTNLERLEKKVKGKLMRFGIDRDADIMAEDIRIDHKRGLSFSLKINREKRRVSLPLFGRHNVYNALAASTVGTIFDMDIDLIKEGLEDFKPLSMRGGIREAGDIRIIDDSYNANPVSMISAIDMAMDLKDSGRVIAVVGDMFELGGYREEAHLKLGRDIVQKGVNHIITIGQSGRLIGEGAINAGMEDGRVDICEYHNEAVDALQRIIKKGDIVLIKGSRGMKMETIIEMMEGYQNKQ